LPREKSIIKIINEYKSVTLLILKFYTMKAITSSLGMAKEIY